MNGADSKHITDKLAFYFSAGISGMIVIPALYIMAFTFAICAVGIIGYAVAALFISLPDIINIGAMVFTGVPALIIAVITGAILLILAFICRKYLKKYMAYVSNRYQKLHKEQ